MSFGRRRIGEQDLLKVTELDCSNFGFCHEDIGSLSMCRNLKSLCLEMGEIKSGSETNYQSLSRFSKVEIW